MTKLTKEELVDLLCLADEALMTAIGCFPLDRTNEKEIFLNDSCKAIRRVTGAWHANRQYRSGKAKRKYLEEYEESLQLNEK